MTKSFIPVTAEADTVLREKLTTTRFRSVEDFIDFYNSGLINVKEPRIKEVVEDIVGTYRDVQERNGKIFFISYEELQLEEINEKLSGWGTLLQLKRTIRDALQEGQINEDTIIVIRENGNIGYLDQQNLNEETQTPTFVKLTTMAVKSHLDKITELSDYDEYNEELEGYLITASIIKNIDSSFIEKLHQNL